MRLRVRHQTVYQYDVPIAYAIQAVRLSPRPWDGVVVLRWRVRGETQRELPSFVDGYGNIVHCHTVDRPHTSAAVLVDGEVETRETHGIVRGAPETLPPAFYLRATELTQPDRALADLGTRAREGRTTLDALHALMHAVRDHIEYRPGVTGVLTPAAEALAAGAGVCQDHAHVFVTAARLLGIPARYVSGYLWTGGPEHEVQASHAWAEAFVADLGWVGFDPANRVCPSETYVRASIGLDYWSAAPVRGVRRGAATEQLTVKVHVQRAAIQQ